MEKAQINLYQLFVLLVLFELSTILAPLGIAAKQAAWLSILIGMIGGLVLFLVYYRLYCYYPDVMPTEYMQILLGRFLGSVLAFLYILYFLYLAARVLRNFGEMLLILAYPVTPLFILNAGLVVVTVYTVRKGIEVLARTGELFAIVIFFLAASSLLLIVLTGLIKVTNLQPMMEVGMGKILETAFSETLMIPFGELIVFTMIFPYVNVNHSKKLRKAGLMAIGFSGIVLAFTMAINISVMGVSIVSRSPFPLLSTIRSIEIAGFLERLDVYFMMVLIIGGFFKFSIILYGAATGTADLFKIKETSRLIYPLGFIVLMFSLAMASSYPEHTYKILHSDAVLFTTSIPFLVVIPIMLLVIAFFKNR